MYARALPSGPDEPRDDMADVLSGAFRAARERILIVTPYYVPGARLQHDLRVAAKSGVDVRLLMPRCSDGQLVDLASRYYVGGLLDAGGHVHLREHRLLHSKAVVVDGRWSVVGSTNLDVRSLDLNYELNLEVPGEDFATSLEGLFESDFAEATELDPKEYADRGTTQRIAERAAALFSPIL